MDVNCKNNQCEKEFKIDTSDLEIESNNSGNHTTQHLASGTIYCPNCEHSMETEYLYDVLDDTGEILSEQVITLI